MSALSQLPEVISKDASQMRVSLFSEAGVAGDRSLRGDADSK